MNNYKKYIFLLYFFTSLFVYSQKGQKILFSREYGNKIHEKFLKKTKTDSVIIFYQNEFVIKDNNSFNKELITKNINKRIPNKNQKGFAVLDWEGNPNHILLGIKDTTPQQYQIVRDNFIECIKYAKKLRPNMKWSFYNYSPIYYGKVDKLHDELVRKKLWALLKNVDFLTPSLYLLDDKTERSEEFTLNDYAQNNIQYAIKLGLELKKPVYPFIWHRYSDHSKSSFGLVELDRFEKFMSVVLKTKYKNQKINGVIWWDCENYVFNNKNNFNATKSEFNTVKSKDSYHQILYTYYYNRIKKNISSK